MCNIGKVGRVQEVPAATPVYRYRGWDVTANGQLQSMYFNHMYWGTGKRIRAWTTPRRHDLAGFYGCRWFAPRWHRCVQKEAHVRGIVALSGMVAFHPLGSRGEYAQPIALLADKILSPTNPKRVNWNHIREMNPDVRIYHHRLPFQVLRWRLALKSGLSRPWLKGQTDD